MHQSQNMSLENLNKKMNKIINHLNHMTDALNSLLPETMMLDLMKNETMSPIRANKEPRNNTGLLLTKPMITAQGRLQMNTSSTSLAVPMRENKSKPSMVLYGNNKNQHKNIDSNLKIREQSNAIQGMHQTLHKEMCELDSIRAMLLEDEEEEED